MKKSEVFFTNFRTTFSENILQKLRRLLVVAGIKNINFQDKFTAIKIHFGEPGNTAYLRPNFAKVVVDLVKELGGKPFLTDCNTLYVGGRKNALDHIDAAYVNGFSPFSTGCHVIIADGLKGTDEIYVPVKKGEFVKEAKIGRAIVDSDIIISLNHFKAHEGEGIGGAIKNLGMGCGSRAGKMEMHSTGKPNVRSNLCIGCMACSKNCAHDAIFFENNIAAINHDKCVGCGRCIGVCPKDAIVPAKDHSPEILNCKTAEYAQAVITGKPNFHVSLVMDVSPYCDCHSENDAPIVNDVGMFASFDPVALDRACVDAVNNQPLLPGTIMEERKKIHNDHFRNLHPTTDWHSKLIHAEKMGLGTQEYKLIEI
ncbi:MAG: DUF362 domain-containing protein [Treponema sp.]|nr:DUF362 domain-containing protein [Treponema sp.]